MKRIKILLAFLAVAGCIGMVLLSPFGDLIRGFIHIKRVESALGRPDVYEPVARTLALYCQSDQALFPDHLTGAWLPPELTPHGSGRGSIDPDSAYVEMGGGFHHFGYHLTRDASQSGENNRWELSLYSEDSPDEHLMTFVIPAASHLTPEQILYMVVAAHDTRIAEFPDKQHLHQDKIETFLHFNRIPEARQACRDMLKLMPDDWWAVLTNALLVSSLESGSDAEQAMLTWVGRDPNYFRYLDLAYYYQLTDQPAKAANAIIKATGFDANTDWGHGGNSEHRGYSAAMYAYYSGQHEAAAQLCRLLSGVTINGQYAKSGLENLGRAAERGSSYPVPWDRGMSQFNPFGPIDIENLLGRKIKRPSYRKN